TDLQCTGSPITGRGENDTRKPACQLLIACNTQTRLVNRSTRSKSYGSVDFAASLRWNRNSVRSEKRERRPLPESIACQTRPFRQRCELCPRDRRDHGRRGCE